MKSNRATRRRRVAEQGGDWRREQRAKRHADEMDTTALRMSPDEARRALAAWAAIPGRAQADVDALNVHAGASVTGGDEAVFRDGGDTGYSRDFFDKVVGNG